MFTRRELEVLLTFLNRVQLTGSESLAHATLVVKIQKEIESHAGK